MTQTQLLEVYNLTQLNVVYRALFSNTDTNLLQEVPEHEHEEMQQVVELLDCAKGDSLDDFDL